MCWEVPLDGMQADGLATHLASRSDLQLVGKMAFPKVGQTASLLGACLAEKLEKLWDLLLVHYLVEMMVGLKVWSLDEQLALSLEDWKEILWAWQKVGWKGDDLVEMLALRWAALLDKRKVVQLVWLTGDSLAGRWGSKLADQSVKRLAGASALSWESMKDA